ncbi:phage tail tape measure protein, partial [Escherichia coli]
ASGQAFLAMAGFTPQAIQAALPGVLSMATAGGMDLGETADIGSNILTQFG